ncbi:MAG TPA: phosphoribosyltransferase family protein [Burkholderiales bacterium]|nr:phosphoribosyltransferase family protein [Burkholderiales bacterium]
MPDLFLSWSDYHRTIESLIAEIHRSKWEFDHIVCIARGGVRVGDIVARVYRKPLAIVLAQHGEGDTPQLSRQIAALHDLKGAILLVDDVAVSGATLATVKSALRERHPAITEIRSAVLWQQGTCSAAPDYRAALLANNPRIHPPYEPYDLSSLQGLVERSPDGDKTG